VDLIAQLPRCLLGFEEVSAYVHPAGALAHAFGLAELAAASAWTWALESPRNSSGRMGDVFADARRGLRGFPVDAFLFRDLDDDLSHR